jgi:ribosome biogenesis GTPase A
MEITQKLGFRDDYDRFYALFVKEVRDGKLGRYTLDRVDEENGND